MVALTLAGDTLVFATFHYAASSGSATARGARADARSRGARGRARRGHVLVSSLHDGEERIVELDEAGHVLGVLTAGPHDESPSILPGGHAWTYLRRAGDAPGLYRCAFGGACARLTATVMPYATVSPTARASRMSTRNPRARARARRLDGSAGRDIGDASSYCRPCGPRRTRCDLSARRSTPEWVEVDVDDVRPTRRTLRGARDCSDGLPDPAAPRATAPRSSSTGAPSCACSRCADARASRYAPASAAFAVAARGARRCRPCGSRR